MISTELEQWAPELGKLPYAQSIKRQAALLTSALLPDAQIFTDDEDGNPFEGTDTILARWREQAKTGIWGEDDPTHKTIDYWTSEGLIDPIDPNVGAVKNGLFSTIRARRTPSSNELAYNNWGINLQGLVNDRHQNLFEAESKTFWGVIGEHLKDYVTRHPEKTESVVELINTKITAAAPRPQSELESLGFTQFEDPIQTKTHTEVKKPKRELPRVLRKIGAVASRIYFHTVYPAYRFASWAHNATPRKVRAGVAIGLSIIGASVAEYNLVSDVLETTKIIQDDFVTHLSSNS